MLTRLHVRGFKNLIDVDVRFGPFTCIAGPNGVGKSNLFDAILFLRELADKPFVEAAGEIRGGENLRGLFAAHSEKKMLLSAEMLIPGAGEDDFGQRAEASATFVRYDLELRLEEAADHRLRERIRLEREDLTYIKKSEASRHLAFPSAKDWLGSVVRSSRRTTRFISTDLQADIVRLHSDRMRQTEKARRGGGKASAFRASTLPRTVLSSARNADESRTAVLVRQEMQNWRLLQLEPSAMRKPDDFQSQDWMTMTGSHIPASLYRIASVESDQEGRVYASVANRLAELVEGVRRIRVDRDDTRKALTLTMTDRYGLELPASALSDGTMRFIALTILQQDPRASGLICLEEPENGIHPQRIDAMLQLLTDITVATDSPVDAENPLRQVIVNTHSPVVAGRIAEDGLLFARARSRRVGKQRVPELSLVCLDGTWREQQGTEAISKGEILSYLRGVSSLNEGETNEEEAALSQKRKRRVIDRFHPGQLPLGFSSGALE